MKLGSQHSQSGCIAEATFDAYIDGDLFDCMPQEETPPLNLDPYKTMHSDRDPIRETLEAQGHGILTKRWTDLRGTGSGPETFFKSLAAS